MTGAPSAFHRGTAWWLVAVLAAIAALVAPGARAAVAPVCTESALAADTFETVAAVDVEYPERYVNWRQQRLPRYRLVVDPYQPCRFFRIGTPARHFADRNVVQRTEDGGRTWQTVVVSRAPGFVAQRLYVPAPNVLLLAESGGGVGVLRSDDAGRTWRPANGGLDPRYVDSIGFAPGNAKILFAVVLECPTKTSDGLCPETLAPEGEDSVGDVALWRSTDGGRNWRQSTFDTSLGGEDTPRGVFVVGAAPGHPEQPYVFDQPLAQGGALRGTEAYVLHTTDGGATFQRRPEPVHLSFRELVSITGGPGGRPRILYYTYGTQTLNVSDDGGQSWSSANAPYKTEFLPTVTGLPGGRLLPHGVVGFGGSFEGNEPRAFFSDDLFRTWRASRSVVPGVPRELRYVLETSQVTPSGEAYLTYGIECRTPATDGVLCPGDPERGYRFVTVRYRPPETGTAIAAPLDPKQRPPVVPTPALTAAGDGCAVAGPGAGLAFDGDALLVGTASDVPYTADVRRLDPREPGCPEVGRIAVRFDPGDLARAIARTVRDRRARTGQPANLTPTLTVRPHIDALAYDGVHGVLYLSLADTTGGKVAQGNAASIWSVPLSGAGHVARLVATPGRCLLHEQEGTGSEVLAWDRETGTLAACQQSRPTTLDPVTGEPDVDANPCYLHAPFRGRGYGWQVTSWTDVEGGRALLLADTVGSGAVLVDYDLTTCRQVAAYGADAIGTAKGGAGRMTQLACDPVTFPDGPVLWQRAGGRVTPFQAPAGITCSVATVTTVVDTYVIPPARPRVNPPNPPKPPVGPKPPAAPQPAPLAPAQPAPVPPAPVPAPGAQAPVGAPGQDEQQEWQVATVGVDVPYQEAEDLADELAMVVLVTGAAAGTALCLRERTRPLPASTSPASGGTPSRTPPSRSARRRRRP